MQFPILRQTAIDGATRFWNGIRQATPIGTAALNSKFASPADDCFRTVAPAADLTAPHPVSGDGAGLPRTEIEEAYFQHLDSQFPPGEPEPIGYYEVEDARFWCPYGVVEAGGRIFPGSYPSPAVFDNPRYALPQIGLPFFPASHHHHAAFLLGGPWGHNYYHVLIDYLPRLLLLDALPEGGRIPIAVPDAGLVGVVQQALTALSLPNPVIPLSPGRHRFKRLILPHRTSRPMDLSAPVCHFFDNALKPALLPAAEGRSPRRRLYLSRRDARIRRLVNEDALADRLQELGFECVTLSGMSLRDQAALFATAESIVGSHGAALANLVFSAPGTHFLEVFGEGHIAPYYRRLGRRRGLRYDLAVGSKDGVDIRVDVERVAARTAAMLESRASS